MPQLIAPSSLFMTGADFLIQIAALIHLLVAYDPLPIQNTDVIPVHHVITHHNMISDSTQNTIIIISPFQDLDFVFRVNQETPQSTMGLHPSIDFMLCQNSGNLFYDFSYIWQHDLSLSLCIDHGD